MMAASSSPLFSLQHSGLLCKVASARVFASGTCSLRKIHFTKELVPTGLNACKARKDLDIWHFPRMYSVLSKCPQGKSSIANCTHGDIIDGEDEIEYMVRRTSKFNEESGAVESEDVLILTCGSGAARPCVNRKHQKETDQIAYATGGPSADNLDSANRTCDCEGNTTGSSASTCEPEKNVEPGKAGTTDHDEDSNIEISDATSSSVDGATAAYNKKSITACTIAEALSEGAVLVPHRRLPKEELDQEGGLGAESSEKLHITSFLKGKHILITGATGFLAKVLVERILRLQPDVAQLYLLIQQRSDLTVAQRLERQIIDSKLFRVLRSQHGDNYRDFMHQKLTAVAGNISHPGLGISCHAVQDMAKWIDVIVNSAANTTFDERYDVALNINTLGPLRLLEFAKLCPKSPLFLQVSTAYVNGKRKGPIPEKPFEGGENLAREVRIHDDNQHVHLVRVLRRAIGPRNYPVLDPRVEVQLAEAALRQAGSEESDPEWRKDSRSSSSTTKDQMVELGLSRAQMFGWQDTYTFTKAMGEMMINAHKDETPVAIVRPSVVESTLREPFSGWIEGLRMLDPILLAYGKGQLDGFLVNPETVLDVIPADIVVNVILAAMAKHAGYVQRNPYVYQVASSVINPLKMCTIAHVARNHFQTNPMMDDNGTSIPVGEVMLYRSEWKYAFHMWMKFKLPSLIANLRWGKKDNGPEKRNAMILEKTWERLNRLAKIYKPYLFYKGRFETCNTQSLLQQISHEELQMHNFGDDVKTVHWYKYLNDIHIPGLRHYVLKDRGTKVTGRLLS